MNKTNATPKSPNNRLPCVSGGGLGRGPVISLFLTILLLLTTLILPALSAFAAPITFQYIYDDTGQLIKVIDSTGTMVEYFYDETGNRIGVTNSTVSGIAIFNFTPKEGPIGQTVTIQGQGFKSIIGDNIVKFNGTTATITTVTANNLTVTVPGRRDHRQHFRRRVRRHGHFWKQFYAHHRTGDYCSESGPAHL